MVVLPAWLDQIPSVNFAPEKELLRDFEEWAQENGWNISDGSNLPLDLRQRTDVLLERPDQNQRIRISRSS